MCVRGSLGIEPYPITEAMDAVYSKIAPLKEATLSTDEGDAIGRRSDPALLTGSLISSIRAQTVTSSPAFYRMTQKVERCRFDQTILTPLHQPSSNACVLSSAKILFQFAFFAGVMCVCPMCRHAQLTSTVNIT